MKRFEKFKEKLFIARLNTQDTEAFAEVYDFYLDRIFRFVYFKVNTKEEAQDLTSEVFLKVWRYIYNQKGKIENMNAFLYQTARNTVSDFYRDKMRNSTDYNLDSLQIEDLQQMKLFSEAEAKVDFNSCSERGGLFFCYYR